MLQLTQDVLRHHVHGDLLHGERGGAVRQVPLRHAGHRHEVAQGQGCLRGRVLRSCLLFYCLSCHFFPVLGGSGSRILMTKKCERNTADKNLGYLFWSELAIYLSTGLQAKGVAFSHLDPDPFRSRIHTGSTTYFLENSTIETVYRFFCKFC